MPLCLAPLLALGGALAAPARAATGAIAVTLVDAETQAPIPYGCAEIWESPFVPTPTGPFAGYACAAGDGVATIDGLTVGTTYYVHALGNSSYAGQWAGGTTWYDAAGFTAPGAVVVAQEKLVTVSGTVRRADGSPADGVTVALSPSGAGRNVSTTTAPDGTWSTTAEPGTYAVAFTDQGYTTYAFGKRPDQPADLVSVPARTSTVVDDTLPAPTRVSGTVVDAATGLPVAGVCASLVRPDDTANITNGYGCTDAAGRYTVTPDAAGPWVVQVIDPAGTYAYERGTAVDVAVGQQVTAAPVAMSIGATITGIAADWTTGAPLANVCAYALAGPTGIFEPGQAPTCSGPDGRWTTGAVHPGATVVASYGDDTHVTGYAPAATTQAAGRVFTTVSGKVTDIGRLRLHRGAVLTGRITDERGRPVEGATVATGLEADPHSSLPFPGVDWTLTQFTARTDADGRYTLTRLEPMVQPVVVYAYGRPLAWQWSGQASDPAKAKAVRLSYDRTTRFDAELQPAATVSVTLRGSTGPGTLSAYTPSGAGVGALTYYTGDGTYELTGLPGSKVYVAAGNPSQRSWYDRAASFGLAKPVSIRAGRTTSITLTLP